ncbi:MAG: alpha/beta hydrolase [Bacteroidia bacterium]|nr:alpha/beta hydrolase [Bacteroidia bacterium]
MKTIAKISMMALLALTFFSCTKERFLDEPGNLVPKTVDQDPGLPSIRVNGALLHAEAFGPADSTMVVFVHGGPGRDYRYLLNGVDLANYGYRVVFYDQRGSGLSQRFPGKFYTNLGLGALDVLYQDLSAVIAHYRTSPNQKVILMGHSWGGMLATGYAGKNPQAIQGLIVGEPGGLKWKDISEYMKASRSYEILEELLNDATYLDQFITGKEDQHEILDYKMAMMASNNSITGEDNTRPGSFWRSGAVIMGALQEIGKEHQPDFSAGISSFQTPVLFFYSGKNAAYPDAWAQKISAAYPMVNLIKVNGVGHPGIVHDRNAWTTITLPAILQYLQSL